MAEQKFCSILDDLHRHKEIDATKLLPLLAQHCLTGLLANRIVKRTFLAPDKKLVEKLVKMSESDAKKQLKRHILRGFHQPKSLTEKRQVFSMMDDGYEVARKGDKEITIKAGAKTLTAKFLGSRHNQALYLISELLPSHAQKLPPEMKKSKSKSRSKSKGGTPTPVRIGGTPTPVMIGGTPTPVRIGGSDDETTTDEEMDGGYDSDDDDQEGGQGLYAFAQYTDKQPFDFPAGMRNLIFNQYHQKYGDLYPLNVQDNWAALAYGSLLVYMNENIPDFRTDYLPFLGNDPLSNLEILLQRYDTNVSSDHSILSDSFLRNWMKSPYYLTDDFGVLREGRDILLSFCQNGLCMEDTSYYASSVLSREREALKELLGHDTILLLGGSGKERKGGLAMKGGRHRLNHSGGQFGLENLLGTYGLGAYSGSNPLMTSLDPTKEKQLREGIVAVYERVSGEPDRFAPGTKALFKKVYEAREIPVHQGLLYNDLLRYMSMSLRDTSPQIYYQAMSGMFGYPPQAATDRILQLGMSPYGMGSGQQYAFPAGVMYDFVESPAFLHMFSNNMSMGDSPVPPFVVAPDGNRAFLEATLVDQNRLGRLRGEGSSDDYWKAFMV